MLLGGSSPDLVSRKNLGRVAATKDNSTLHKTMENLHNFIEPPQIHYDEEGKVDQVGGFSQQVSNHLPYIFLIYMDRNLNNYFNFHVRLSIFPFVPSVRVSKI